MEVFIGWITSAIIYGTVIMLASCGETLTERAGHLNLGVHGIMFVSGFSGYLVAYKIENLHNGFLTIVLPILVSLLVGAILGLLYSFMTVTVKCNQNVMGLALTSFGVGMGKFLASANGISDAKATFAGDLFNAKIPLLSDIPFIGDVIFGYGFMIYLTIIILVLCHLFLKKTRIGLNLKAVGESPQTADATGISVSLYKYVATTIGCSLCGLAGIVYVLVFCNGLWATNNGIEGLGWLAVALVIFASWKPIHLIWGSYLFGLLIWAYNVLPTLLNLPKFRGQAQLLEMLPYVVTIIVLIINSILKNRENQPPASLGTAYFREDR